MPSSADKSGLAIKRASNRARFSDRGAAFLTSKIVRGGQVVWGTPARPLKEHLTQLANVAKLPALREEVAELKRRLSELEAKR